MIWRGKATYVVEVGHDDLETLTFLAEHVLYGNLGVVELDVGGSCCCRVRCLDDFCLDGVAAGHEEDAEALCGLEGDEEVVAKHSVGNPLLCAGDQEVLSIFGEFCCGTDAGYI